MNPMNRFSHPAGPKMPEPPETQAEEPEAATESEASPRDMAIAAETDPEFQHPDAEQHFKQISLRRHDVVAHRSVQTVHVHPCPVEGYSTAPKPGHLVSHALAAGMVPEGYTLSINGKELDPDEDLYSQVRHGDTVDVLPPKPKGHQEYPKAMRHKTSKVEKVAKDEAEETKLFGLGYK